MIKREHSNERERFVSFGVVLMAGALFTFTLCIFGPVQLFVTNINEFKFGILDVCWPCLICGAVVFWIISAIGFLLRRKHREYYACLIIGLALALYIQGNFITTKYDALDGNAVDWSSYGWASVWNTGLWVLCLAVPFVVRRILRKNWVRSFGFATCFILAIQVVTLGTLCLTTDLSNQPTGYFSDSGEYSVSKEKNIVYLLLDTFDIRYMDAVLEASPEYAEELEGFTYFRNCTGSYPTTKGAVAFLLSGKYYENKQPYSEYLNEANQDSEFFTDLVQNGFDVGVYTDSILFSPGASARYVDNYIQDNVKVSSHMKLLESMIRFTAFRYAPHVAKQALWFYSGVFDELVHGESYAPYYESNNLRYYQKLINEGLTLNDSSCSYRFIHLNGVHPPFEYNEHMEVIENEKDYVDANTEARGVFKIALAYMDELRKLGVYDQTEIVVLADHGATDEKLTNPLLLVKPPYASGAMKVSEAPVSHEDLRATVMDAVGLNHNGIYGTSIFDIEEDSNRQRRYLYYVWDGKWDSDYLPDMQEYSILPTGNEPHFYIPTGRVYSSSGITESVPYQYTMGDSILFTKDNNGTRYFCRGISFAEVDSAWSLGKEGYLTINFTEAPKTDIIMDIHIKSVLGGRQNLIVENYSDKSQTLFDDIVVPGTVSIYIPKECVNGSTLMLRIQYPGAITPKSLGMNEDMRELAISYSKIVFRETDRKQTQISPYSISLGEEILFTEDNNGCRFFTAGISIVESDSAWSLGTEGQMRFCFTEPPANSLRMCLHFKSVYHAPQTLTIYSGDTLLYERKIEESDQDVELVIPISCIQGNELLLDLFYPGAVSPASLNESADERELAFSFQRMVIREVTESED